MIITSSINIDLARMGVIPPIYAIQDDKYSRNLEVNLYSNGVPWSPPEEFNAFACYKKEDGIGGEYDTMPDGTKAWNIEENVLTFALAPQVLTVPGKVAFSIRMISGISELSTFIIPVIVEPRPDFEVNSEEYVNMKNWLVSELNNALILAKESGAFKGENGEKGEKGDPGDPGVHVGADKPPETAKVWIKPNGIPTGTETWTFTLEDGTTVKKTVVVVG